MAKCDISSDAVSGKRRYFYTDPLAAAWMAKYFGMKYEPESELHALARLTDVLQLSYRCKIYLRPNFLHLLEPRVGDVIQDAVDIYRANRVPLQNEHGNSRTIQRNGFPFHWPESDEVEPAA